MRPSMMWILRTPLVSVSRQASTLGIMPASIAPLAISRRASASVSEWISESGSSFSRRTPFTSLRKTSFSAPSAWATAVAAVSAFTFSRSPPASVSHIDGITGTWPA